MTSSLILAALSVLALLAATTGSSLAHDNKYVHPFAATGVARRVVDALPGEEYDTWLDGFNETTKDTNGYDPAHPDPSLCRQGTRGTIQEDDKFNPDNALPFLQHYWVAWGDHDTPWELITRTDNAIDYAREILDGASMLFADGREEEAFFQFGRALHVAEDMGSPPHVCGGSHLDLLQTPVRAAHDPIPTLNPPLPRGEGAGGGWPPRTRGVARTMPPPPVIASAAKQSDEPGRNRQCPTAPAPRQGPAQARPRRLDTGRPAG